MLDEEVTLFWNQTAPRHRLASAGRVAANVTKLAGLVGAGYAGNRLFEVGLFGTGVCATGGFIVVDHYVDKIANALQKRRNLAYAEQQSQADQEAIEMGAKSFSIEYRGSKLRGVLRADREEGHIFSFGCNDGILLGGKFSYQPNRAQALTFLFDVLPFKPLDALALSMESLRRSQADLERASVGTAVKKKPVEDPLQNYQQGMKPILEGSTFTPSIIIGDESTGTKLTYSGENYRTNLPAFLVTASKLMNVAYYHRTRLVAGQTSL